MSLSPPELRLEPDDYREIVRRALEEDLGGSVGTGGDVTTEATVPAIARARGAFITNGDCVIAGLDVAVDCFRALDSGVRPVVRRRDGDRCRAGDIVAEVIGSARALLVGE